MRNFKIFLWIFIIFLIQTVLLARVHIFGAVPSAVMAYVVCVMLLENEFRNAVTISLICAAAAGALCGREFVVITLFYVYSSIVIFTLRDKPVYVGNYAKAIVWTFISSVAMETALFAVEHMTVSMSMFMYNALPTAVCNMALAALIYPLLKALMYKEKKKKLLIV